jgi:hypothetical protein
LENFIIRKFQDLQEKLFSFKKPEIKIEDKELPLMFRNYKLNDEQKTGKKLLDEQFIANNQSNVGKVNSSRSFNRIKKVRNEAGHVGFGFNNRDMIFVENNAIIQKNILYDKKKIQEIILPEKKREELINDMFSIKRNENTRISAIFQPVISNNNKISLNNNEIMKSLKEGKNMEEDDINGMEYMIFIDKAKMDEKQLISYYKKARRRVCLKLDEIENTTNFRNENYKDSIHYKKLANEHQKGRKKFNLTATNFYRAKMRNKTDLKNNFISSTSLDKTTNQKKLNTLNMEKAYQNLVGKTPQESKTNRTITYLKTQPNITNKKKFELALNVKTKLNENKNNNEDNLDYIDLNRNNIASDRIKKLQEKWKEYDQLSPEQRQRREFLESKKKWVSKEDFHRVFGLHTTAIKPLPNVLSYGKPVTDYKFREVNHEKWLTPNGFL